MPRISVLQSLTFVLLIVACVYVAHHVAGYILRVDGGFSEWSGFTDCTKSCGGGIRMRRRTCSQPYPRLGGQNCSVRGKPIQVVECNRLPCPVNGGYGQWLEYGACSVTCGGGSQSRRRRCENPVPQYGGKHCKQMELGEDIQTRTCNGHKCAVNGGYTEWSKFEDCSVTCGGGTTRRSRECTNPKPEHGGTNCSTLRGPSIETVPCNTAPCPPPPTTARPTTERPTTERPTTERPTTKQPPTKTQVPVSVTSTKQPTNTEQIPSMAELEPTIAEMKPSNKALPMSTENPSVNTTQRSQQPYTTPTSLDQPTKILT